CGLEAGRFWFKNNFYVLHNGIDCDKYAYSNNIKNEVKEELRIKNAFVAGHIGRVYPPQKNHPFLFSVFSRIKKIHPDSVLLCIGAEKDEYLADLAAEYKIEKDVFFLGERKDVFKLLNAMDVFIFPSFKEGLPVSLIEAQANGLPALVSDSVTDECVINENVNMLSLNDSPEVWAEKALEIGGKRISGGADKLKKSGWDIYECAGRLADYYKTGIFKI
ncbi:MAG: glycosyltransferase, partial [Clostridiales bacterium]|nr:glycosyltransferase [Clostridiales bacterium]